MYTQFCNLLVHNLNDIETEMTKRCADTDPLILRIWIRYGFFFDDLADLADTDGTGTKHGYTACRLSGIC